MQFLIVAGMRPGMLESGLPENFEQLIEQEIAHAKKDYLKGSLRQIWLQTPGPGAVAIVEADSLESAEKIVADFPLSQAGFLDAKVIALMPYAGFGDAA
jgi:hypothetical protein